MPSEMPSPPLLGYCSAIWVCEFMASSAHLGSIMDTLILLTLGYFHSFVFNLNLGSIRWWQYLKIALNLTQNGTNKIKWSAMHSLLHRKPSVGIAGICKSHQFMSDSTALRIHCTDLESVAEFTEENPVVPGPTCCQSGHQNKICTRVLL